MITRILVAHDSSPTADKAFRMALDIACRYGAELHAVSVVRLPEFGEDVETAAMIDAGRQHYDKLGLRLRDEAGGRQQALHFRTLVGHPAEQVVGEAQKIGADLIVLGHRGKSLIERWLTGSTTKQVMGYAHCAVLVVR
ncbi:MAG: universal stress protein [Nevskia sp.]|nr:universal stress protein [Nevskia sp.]